MKGGKKSIERYKRVLCLPEEAVITESMIQKHWRLETRLAGEILRSSKEHRTETIRMCYDRFYRELSWLNDKSNANHAQPVTQREESVIFLVGKPRKRILEVGSGSGELIDALSAMGHECMGTDINQKRFAARENPRLQLREHDGVKIQHLAESGGFDVVLSLNVLEHFHPDDVDDHFRDVYHALKPGGEYILKTPHQFFGPHGIERVFGVFENSGLHLKEYTYRDVREFAERAGFHEFRAVMLIPMPVRKILKRMKMDRIGKSGTYLEYLILVERFIRKIRNRKNRKSMSMAFRFLLLPRQVFIVFSK
jgi:2-polyprenyl-3-methyl-5-hydroxy-6-metoxy-1,4-benzoquinol methylase